MNGWQQICEVDRLPVGRGVCALVDGEQVAVFRTSAGQLHAVGNRDPFSGAMVLARGILGSRGGRSTVASPMFKQVFDLATGRCLDDDDVQLPVHPVRVRGTAVEIQLATAVRQPA